MLNLSASNLANELDMSFRLFRGVSAVDSLNIYKKSVIIVVAFGNDEQTPLIALH